MQIEKFYSVGDTKINNNLFGGNLIFDRDKLNGEFSEAVSNLGVTSLRYPGGGVSEKRDEDSGDFLFDVTNPNASSIQRITTDENGDEVWYDHPLIPVSDFISHANENDMGMTFVIPTSETYGQNYKMVFGDPNWQPPTENGEEVPIYGMQSQRVNAILQYARDLIDGKYGNISGAVLEIGNEFYALVKNSTGESVEYPYAYASHTAETYGIVASHLAKEISDYAESVGKRDQIEIHVQTGMTEFGGEKDKNTLWNSSIINEFNSGELDAIDGVTTHFYPWDKDALVDYDPTSNKDHNDDRAKYVNAWSAAAGRELDLNVSEWNVGSPNGVDGLLQVGVLAEFFEFFQRNGVDQASVWPVKQNTQNDLSGNGDGEALTLAGEFFQMAARSLVGKTLYESSDGSAEIESYYYTDSSGNITLILVNTAANALLQDLDLTGIAEYGDTVAVSNLKAHNSGTDVAAYMDPAAEAHLAVASYDGDVGSIALDFMQHGVIVINIAKTEGLNIQADLQIGAFSGETGAETFSGTPFADSINLGAGDDLLYGQGGDDILAGDSGDDTLDGGNGNDILKGGDGDDHLFGQLGDDFIAGDLDDDTLNGGSGNDTLEGNNGADYLWGDTGNDDLRGGEGEDTLYGKDDNDILNGENGDDLLDGGSGDDYLYGGTGSDRVFGQNGDDFLFGQEDDDLLNGGAGADVIAGGLGNDTLYGGAGSDTFIFQTGEGVDSIRDFEIGIDIIDISGLNFASETDAYASIEQSGSHVWISSGLDVLEVRNATVADVEDVIIW